MTKRNDGLDHISGKFLSRIFLSGPLEAHCLPQPVIQALDITHGLIEICEIHGGKFYDLSPLGRYHMTGEHSAMMEKPWRPA